MAVSATCIGGAATFASDIGFGDLVDRLGADQVPTGAGVNVSQTEVIAGGAYGPWQDDPEFSTITFTAMSGSPGVSGHATEVAKNFYGNTVSIAPGIPGVWLYEVNSFLNSYLRVGQGNSALPLVPPGGVRIFNHSWIGSAGSATDNDVNRRADFAMNRDDTLFIAGLNNTLGTPPPLMNSMFNGLSVGRADGVHSYGNVAAGDVPGRMKPEIVAPGSATSWTAPIVGSVAALLYETANTLPLSANPNARKGVVIKSAIMAGAHRRAGWTNNPVLSGPNRGVAAKPLDTIYGADVVNINRAHLILTAGEQEGSATVPSSPSIGARGWDYRSMLPNTTVYYRFTLTEAVEDVSILVTWNRAFGSTISAGIPGNLDLRLFKVLPGATDLLPLTGDAGIGVFDAGNVASLSTVDNVELLFLRDLAAGEYVIELKRVDAAGIAVQTALSWIMPETPETPPPVPGDVNGDGIVNGADIAIVLGSWGVCIGCAADLNGDGVVDGADLSVVLGNWSS
ncbi:MAG: hypothetical protein KF724_04535 [Phycisphaeraceae bacterium]|nr:hypothetical protein [Phycisphaeraceae bacterium]